MKLFFTFLLASIEWNYSQAATHWAVTQDGRIQAEDGSYFEMRQPHDLVEFLRQEQRVAKLRQMESDGRQLTLQKLDGLSRVPTDWTKLTLSQKDLPVECRDVYSSDYKPGTYTITSSALTLDAYGFDAETFIGQRRSLLQGKTPIQPHCSLYFKIPFSMHTFEHLPAMHSNNRWMMEISPIIDAALVTKMLSYWPSAADFGHYVTLALKETPTSWVLHNMATFYWRVVGNGPEALECTRTALHLTPWRHQPMPLLNLANILLTTHNVDDAVVVLDALLAINDTLPAAYCKSAEAYAMQDNQNASIYAYDACLLLDPDFPNAVEARARVLCDEVLHRRIFEHDVDVGEATADVVEKLREYKQLQGEILKKTASAAVRLSHSLAYDYLTYGSIGNLDCSVETEQKSKSDFISCHVPNKDQHDMLRDIMHEQAFGTRPYGETDDSEPIATSNPQIVAHVGSNSEPLDPSPGRAHEHLSQDAFVADLAQTIRLRTTQFLFENASFGMKYPLGEEGYYNKDVTFLSPTWPAQTECGDTLSRSEKMNLRSPQVFVSPVEKGFPVKMWLTDRMGLTNNRMHPLPWYPPSCVQDAPLDAPVCDALLGVQRVKNMAYAPDFAEMQLERTFLDLVGGVSDSVAEVGQRVNTALTLNLAPRWVLLNLAGLYWRIKGVPQEAVACLRQVLVVSEQEGLTTSVMAYRDVTLVQLAQVVDVAGGRLDDSIVLLRRALAFNQFQPQTHYLLATYLARKGNLTGAASHLRIALLLEPDLQTALSDYKKVMCELKHGVKKSKGDFQLEPLDVQFRSLLGVAASANSFMKDALGKRLKCGTDHGQFIDVKIPRDMCIDAFFNPICLAPRSLEPWNQFRKTSSLGELNSYSHFCVKVTHPSGSSDKCMMHTGKSLAPVTYIAQDVPCIRAPGILSFLSHSLTDVRSGHNLLSQGQAAAPGTPQTSIPTTDGDTDQSAESSADSAPTQPDEDEGAEVTLDFDNSNQIVTYPAPEIIIFDSKFDVDSSPKTDGVQASQFEKEQHVDNIVNFPYPRDTELPEILPRPQKELVMTGVKLVGPLPTTSDECASLKDVCFFVGEVFPALCHYTCQPITHVRVNLEQPTSTWLSVTARGVDLTDLLQFRMLVENKSARVDPVCPEVTRVKIWLLDHLSAFQNLEEISHRYTAETGLKDAFENLGPKREESSLMATRMTLAMMHSRRVAEHQERNLGVGARVHCSKKKKCRMDLDGGVPWALSTVAALYWRVKGDAKEAVKCLRHALANSPPDSYSLREPALVSMANVYHRMHMHRSALITAGVALETGPKTVVTHFTLANIYASMGNLELAGQFYLSTLALQNNFEPARDRLKAIYCLTGQLPIDILDGSS